MNPVIRPTCSPGRRKETGRIHNGKQNHPCKGGGRQFVIDKTQKPNPEPARRLIRKALLGGPHLP